MTGMQLASVLKLTQHAFAGKGRFRQGCPSEYTDSQGQRAMAYPMTPRQRHEFALERVLASKKRTYSMMPGPVPKQVSPSRSLNLRECYR